MVRPVGSTIKDTINSQFIAPTLKNKEYVLRFVWIKKNEKNRAKILQKLSHRLHQLERPQIVNLLRIHLQQGDRVVVISASPLFYLRPYVQFWSEDIKVFGSELQIVNGKIKFDNLYGLRKELCARSIIEQEKPSEVWIYTDHISDLPIIKLADHVRLVRPSAKLCDKLRQLTIKYEIVSL